MVQIFRKFGKSLYSAKKAGNQEGLKPVSEKILNQDRWKMLALKFGSWHAWLREWLIKVHMLLKSWLENVYRRIKNRYLWKLVFGSLLCPSFIQIDEQRKENQFRWLKKKQKTLSFQPSRLDCCLQIHLVIGNTWQQQEISFTKQKVFQRPFSQVNGYLINQTGKDSKCLQNNCIQQLQAHSMLFSWAFSLF